ncbi:MULTISPECIES: polysaccharide deacetylase family protein [unclassified Streptomyces]|uniref:polysaccharide deacetylase family protein n=1 Tax=unclassified Streptomyces TaxID=2593676 RepID=UPI000DBA7E99|nr:MULTISPECIES: polysaccharide deacetylase family protein [unclassified Streptomyces]MYT68555.1 polysaccharide deacetylase family protein [Streptomyces sp. SID8367]RAJ86227.1 peptidoglycan/xylan/chitin deacetylase (PgdA/CDA1 family) [Streptomyces sp. PsTaAH-137]
MQLVRQNEKSGRRRTARRLSVAVLAACALASGCAAGGDSTTVRPAPGQQPLKAPPAQALDSYATRLKAERARVVTAAKHWGLAKPPLTAPAPPAHKPHIEPRKGFEVDDQKELGLPPVFTTIPTKQKIVFLTIDDGAEKDPAFVKMMSDLKIPYTAFLSDYLAKEDYGYFTTMQKAGVGLNNHTLTHPYLPGLSYAGQRREICGMQDVIEKHYGKRPTLFRPPYGNYNQATLKAAKSCGVKYAPIWNAEVFVDRMDYREWDRDIHPGDIILTHFRGREDWKGTMPDMIRTFMKYVTAKGYAVARLEDYL